MFKGQYLLFDNGTVVSIAAIAAIASIAPIALLSIYFYCVSTNLPESHI